MSADLKSLPKAEVHVHLEGCFDVDTIERLAETAGERLPRPKHALFEFTDLSTFLGFLDWTCGLVRTAEQLTEAAYAFSQRMAASGARYSDVIVNPTHWPAWHDRLPEFISALDRGFARAETERMPAVGLCVSLLRQQTAEEALAVVETLINMRHPRVVALSIDGNEKAAGRTGPRFAEAFQRAGAAGLRRTVHAGESSGPEGVWDAIELLGAERIDHGVRAIEDPRLVDVLAEHKIALGICPTSNIVGRLYGSLKEHPIERLRRAGVPVSVNTDDPAFLGISLTDEYRACADAFGWDAAKLREVATTSINASFATRTLKQRALTELAAWQ
jgi:adenosine deaminase